MVKTSEDYRKTYREKKGDEYKIKDAARKVSERGKRKYLEPKKHDELKKRRGSTDKRISVKEENGRTICL